VLKIVVNATKGGVGKTTVATNIALLLAQQNYRVWALDLAGRSRMGKFLESTGHFANDKNKIDIRETCSLVAVCKLVPFRLYIG
jgi:chromosome partitioning protein